MSTTAIKLTDVRVTGRALRSARLNPPDNDSEDVILDGLSLELAAGGVLSVLGESGGGKSTLFRCINRLIEVDSGSVEVLGKPVGEWNIRELRSQVVFVPQRSFLFGGTVRDELARVLNWHDQPEDDFAAVLKAVQLDVELAADASELSEGQKHRLCIARAMLLKPKILMLDEPTGALDARTAREVLAAVKTWAESTGATLLLITHRLEDLETLSGKSIVIENGKVCDADGSSALTAKSSGPRHEGEH